MPWGKADNILKHGVELSAAQLNLVKSPEKTEEVNCWIKMFLFSDQSLIISRVLGK